MGSSYCIFDEQQKLLFTSRLAIRSQSIKASLVRLARLSSFRARPSFCLGRIRRLVFQNVGVRKYGRRNLRFAMYTGSDVAEALSLAEKKAR